MRALLERWLDRLEADGLLVGGRAATAARLQGWLPWLQAAAEGDASAEAELLRIVAFDARNQAQEGRPASLAVSQPLLLAAVWSEVSAEVSQRLSQLLVRVAADAHALGAAGVKDGQQRTLLGRRTPVTRFGDRWLGFIVGPLDAEVVDVVLDRLLVAAVGAGARETGVDLSGAEAPNPLFLRTLEGFAKSDTGSVARLTVTGVVDAPRYVQALAANGVRPERVAFGRLDEWLQSTASR